MENTCPIKAEDANITPAPIFWLTGLSGAGKSTVARLLAARIRGSGITCVLLDGDELRELWPGSGGFTRPERIELGLNYARLCAMISRNGVCVVIATIALYQQVHQWLDTNAPQRRVVWIDVPLSELRRRDPKGIYSRFDSGQIQNVAGLDLPVDWPQAPWIHVRWHQGLTAAATLDMLWPDVSRDLEWPCAS